MNPRRPSSGCTWPRREFAPASDRAVLDALEPGSRPAAALTSPPVPVLPLPAPPPPGVATEAAA